MTYSSLSLSFNEYPSLRSPPTLTSQSVPLKYVGAAPTSTSVTSGLRFSKYNI